MLHKEAISAGTLALLNEIMNNKEFNQFFLVGGTSLALQFGHRMSEDLDFFSPTSFLVEEFIEKCKKSFPQFQLYSETTIGFRSVIQGIKADFLHYSYPLLKSTTIEKIRMFSPEDIAAMKIKTIGNRGEKKDFFDLNELFNHFTLGEMINLFKKKYSMTDIGHYFISLTYFTDAEQNPDPVILNEVTWEEVKTSIKEKVTSFLKDELKK